MTMIGSGSIGGGGSGGGGGGYFKKNGTVLSPFFYGDSIDLPSNNDGVISIRSSLGIEKIKFNTNDICYFNDVSVAFGHTVPKAGVDIQNSIRIKITRITTATYDILSNDFLIAVDYSATGTSTITLPPILNDGAIFNIKDTGYNSGTNAITVQTTGADKIENLVSPLLITSDGTSIKFCSDFINKNWLII